MSDVPPPHRRYRFQLDLQADDLKSLVADMRHYTTLLLQERITAGASGGYSSGASYALTIDEDMTHEKWEADLDAYLAQIVHEDAKP